MHLAELVSLLLALYGTPEQPARPGAVADSQVYETIVQSMSWLHKLTAQADLMRLAAPEMPQDYQQEVSQEVQKLAGFIRQYVVGTTKPLLSTESVLK